MGGTRAGFNVLQTRRSLRGRKREGGSRSRREAGDVDGATEPKTGATLQERGMERTKQQEKNGGKGLSLLWTTRGVTSKGS